MHSVGFLLTIILLLSITGCTDLTSTFKKIAAQASDKVASLNKNHSSAEISGTPVYSPLMVGSPLDPTPPPPGTVLGPPLAPPIAVVAVQPVDFESARAAARAQGKDISFVKVGFHLGPGGNANGWGEYVRKLNTAGVPVFVKSVDNGGPIWEVQQIMKENENAGRDIPHTLVYRSTDKGFEDIYYDLSLSPEEAASRNWQANRDAIPRELDKKYFWLETLNEPGRYGFDGNLQIERLARFSLASAKLAVAQGYKYAALSFSTGVPEVGAWPAASGGSQPNDWEHPAMLDFLRYAGQHRDQVAISLHEYSLTNDYIGNGYPYLVGRFQALFDTADRYGIPRPTVLITEWGWEYNSVPEPIPAREDISWASWLYAAYPEVLGASIWYLGPGFGGIANLAQRLIAPMSDYAASNYFIIETGKGRIDSSLFVPNPPTLWEPNLEVTPFPRPQFME